MSIWKWRSVFLWRGYRGESSKFWRSRSSIGSDHRVKKLCVTNGVLCLCKKSCWEVQEVFRWGMSCKLSCWSLSRDLNGGPGKKILLFYAFRICWHFVTFCAVVSQLILWRKFDFFADCPVVGLCLWVCWSFAVHIPFVLISIVALGKISPLFGVEMRCAQKQRVSKAWMTVVSQRKKSSWQIGMCSSTTAFCHPESLYENADRTIGAGCCEIFVWRTCQWQMTDSGPLCWRTTLARSPEGTGVTCWRGYRH